MKKLTQADMVLRHLKDHNTITTWEAIENYGITRLSAIIFNLKEQGYRIGGEMKGTFNRYGEPVSWKEYKLETNK